MKIEVIKMNEWMNLLAKINERQNEFMTNNNVPITFIGPVWLHSVHCVLLFLILSPLPSRRFEIERNACEFHQFVIFCSCFKNLYCELWLVILIVLLRFRTNWCALGCGSKSTKSQLPMVPLFENYFNDIWDDFCLFIFSFTHFFKQKIWKTFFPGHHSLTHPFATNGFQKSNFFRQEF